MYLIETAGFEVNGFKTYSDYNREFFIFKLNNGKIWIVGRDGKSLTRTVF